MIDRDRAFGTLGDIVTDELVVTGIGSQTAFWFESKHRPENLYLRGPMGLAPAVGLGVALAHPARQVIAIEGDGSIMMALSSLAAVAHTRPDNFILICVDNGTYEAAGKGPTVNSANTDFVALVKGIGITDAVSVESEDALRNTLERMLAARKCAFLHVPMGVRKEAFKPPKLRPYEKKYQFLSALK